MSRITWTIKVSKLCNLRCRYCYEWDQLDDPARISLEDWKTLLLAVRSYHERQEKRLGDKVRSQLVWHGGEPLTLPLDYMKAVLALERAILGPEALARGDYVNALQSNLYALPEEKLRLLKDEHFRVGVSMDYIGGVRLARGGAETEERVAGNMDRLAEAGIPFGAIVVLAGHTAPHLRHIYDFMAALELPFRVLPLFPSPLNTPGASFAMGSGQMVDALNDLFVHWLDKRCGISVEPLERYLETVLLKMNGLERVPWNRRVHGDGVLIVNTDGALYQVIDAYDEKRALGNVFRQSIDDILGSPSYRASLERCDDIVERHCGPCRYHGTCSTGPVFESRIANPPDGRCAVAYHVQAFIEQYLRETGFDEQAFRELRAEAEAPL